MTNDEKQALIEWAHKWIEPAKRIAESNPADKSAQASLALYEIALTALTAQPVSIKNSDFESALRLLNDVIDDCGDSERGLLLALSRMGIEVQE